MKRTIPVVLVALSFAASFEAQAQRVRAVRHPAPQCSFGLSVTMASPVAAGGISDGAITVVPSPSTCTSWNAYSDASWVTLTRLAGNALRVEVAPNPSTTPRSTTLLIAGLRYEIAQDGGATVSPPIEGNVLRNAGFDTDLSFWGWQDRFRNGTGSAAWSSMDVKGNPHSGSIRLRNTRPEDQGLAFQQLQCVDVEGGQIYEFGGSFNAASPSDVEPVFGVVEYEDEGCDAQFVWVTSESPRADGPNVWTTKSYTMRMGPNSKSALMIIGSLAKTAGTHDVFIDDVLLKKR